MPLWEGNNPIQFGPGSVKSIVAWYDSSSIASIPTVAEPWEESANVLYAFRDIVTYLGNYYDCVYQNNNIPPLGPIPVFPIYDPGFPNIVNYFEGNAVYDLSNNESYSALFDVTNERHPGNNPEWSVVGASNSILMFWKPNVEPLNSVISWRDKTRFQNNLYPDFNYDIPGQVRYAESNNRAVFANNSILVNNPNKLLEFKTPITGATIFCVAGLDRQDISLGISNEQVPVITHFVSVFANSIGINPSIHNITIGCHVYSNTGAARRSIRGLIYDNRFSSFSNLPMPPQSTDIFDDISSASPIIFTGLISDNQNDMSLYLNGRKIMSNSRQPVITSDINNFNIFVGDSSNYTASISGSINLGGGAYLFPRHASVSRFREIIIYSTKLSASDISDIHRYLQNKYNISSLHNGGNFSY